MREAGERLIRAVERAFQRTCRANECALDARLVGMGTLRTLEGPKAVLGHRGEEPLDVRWPAVADDSDTS